MGQWIDLHTAHGDIAAWRAEPAGKPRGAIVVIQEIFGVNPHIRSVAGDFASEGYVALAPAFFDVLEPGVELGYDDEGIARGRDLITRLGLEKTVGIVDDAARSLSGIGPIGTVGYCWGGTVALLAALRLGLPSVSYYGSRDVPFLGEAPKAPLIFHFGERDKSIPPEMVQQHRDALPQMPVYTYPADHGFNCDARASYDPASAKLARQRTLAFFADHLA
ncbi:carboxymethylenebutenolidase [Pseudoxanthomonas yeongjuensis]|uniref:dienelactone hydrolase family protein n=1 Tax=Pseudoxanthomonas yeongjuensis TaxID=377616 RepID=UPI001391A0F9|nr:dienelactone hydrolase family protein [Pseudoxanthomonas yeongjuensis]KAF1718137.1 carboxymethylenebutenolidase [Pseudoxanthomonas yeongjuensis]